jgi:hypothetical protein
VGEMAGDGSVDSLRTATTLSTGGAGCRARCIPDALLDLAYEQGIRTRLVSATLMSSCCLRCVAWCVCVSLSLVSAEQRPEAHARGTLVSQ